MSLKQQRNTRQRQLVLDVVRGRRDHPTAEQIYQSVREQDAHVSRGTVYRNLNLLCDNREIYRVVMSNSDRFDLRTSTGRCRFLLYFYHAMSYPPVFALWDLSNL